MKRVKFDISTLVRRLIVVAYACHSLPDRGVSGSYYDFFIVWKISDNISETGKDRDIVTMED